MIHEEICTYEVSKLAKEKGFPQNIDYIHLVCPYNYFNHKGELNGSVGDLVMMMTRSEEIPDEMKIISAPPLSILQRWLREEKGIHIEIVATACGYFWIADKTNGTAITDSDILDRGTNEGGCFDSFELCLEDALKYILQNLV